ncbi:MAG: DUF58 domain-containing protein [Steroidobacteraceae bacterium]
MASLMDRLRRRLRAWARRGHGIASDPIILSGRRIYILPTRLGAAFGVMLFAMFVGAMNYANNLALALTFTLASLGLTAMHYCQRNLAGVKFSSAGSEPVFAGQQAKFRIAVENPSTVPRLDIAIKNDHSSAPPVRVDANGRAVLEISVPATRRGRVVLEFFQPTTVHPFGLFRAWAYLHMPLHCIVYPRPSERAMAPPPLETDTGGAQNSVKGDEDFAGLRGFNPGDPPSRIAWKAYARGQGLHVKVYAGTAVKSHQFDWDALTGLGVEARLSQMCRWIEDAYAAGRAFGLRLPGLDVPPNVGPAHRQRCLTALALFDGAGE